MHRRHFLKALAAAVAGAAVDPERLLWVPGERTLVLPPRAGWYTGIDWASDPDSRIVIRFILSQEALYILRKNLNYAKVLNREYDRVMEPGSTIRVSKPRQYYE